MAIPHFLLLDQSVERFELHCYPEATKIQIDNKACLRDPLIEVDLVAYTLVRGFLNCNVFWSDPHGLTPDGLLTFG